MEKYFLVFISMLLKLFDSELRANYMRTAYQSHAYAYDECKLTYLLGFLNIFTLNVIN